MALVTFTLKDFQLEALADRQPTVVFTASAPATSFGYVLSTVPIRVPLSPNGSGSVDLVPTTTMPQQGIYYSMKIEVLGETAGEYTHVDFPDWKLYVPSDGGSFDDLITMPVNPRFTWVGTTPPPGNVPLGTLWYNPVTDDVQEMR